MIPMYLLRHVDDQLWAADADSEHLVQDAPCMCRILDTGSRTVQSIAVQGHILHEVVGVETVCCPGRVVDMTK